MTPAAPISDAELERLRQTPTTWYDDNYAIVAALIARLDGAERVSVEADELIQSLVIDQLPEGIEAAGNDLAEKIAWLVGAASGALSDLRKGKAERDRLAALNAELVEELKKLVGGQLPDWRRRVSIRALLAKARPQEPAP